MVNVTEMKRLGPVIFEGWLHFMLERHRVKTLTTYSILGLQTTAYDPNYNTFEAMDI